MLAPLVLVVLVLLAGTGDHIGRVGAVLLAAVSVLWLLTDKQMEGATLVELTDAHGLTAGDLSGLAGIGLAAWRWRDLR